MSIDVKKAAMAAWGIGGGARRHIVGDVVERPSRMEAEGRATYVYAACSGPQAFRPIMLVVLDDSETRCTLGGRLDREMVMMREPCARCAKRTASALPRSVIA